MSRMERTMGMNEHHFTAFHSISLHVTSFHIHLGHVWSFISMVHHINIMSSITSFLTGFTSRISPRKQPPFFDLQSTHSKDKAWRKAMPKQQPAFKLPKSSRFTNFQRGWRSKHSAKARVNFKTGQCVTTYFSQAWWFSSSRFVAEQSGLKNVLKSYRFWIRKANKWVLKKYVSCKNQTSSS